MIDALTDDYVFWYHGKMGEIEPFSRTNIHLCFDEEEIQVNSVEKAMTTPFIEGKTLEEVAEELYIE